MRMAQKEREAKQCNDETVSGNHTISYFPTRETHSAGNGEPMQSGRVILQTVLKYRHELFASADTGKQSRTVKPVLL